MTISADKMTIDERRDQLCFRLSFIAAMIVFALVNYATMSGVLPAPATFVFAGVLPALGIVVGLFLVAVISRRAAAVAAVVTTIIGVPMIIILNLGQQSTAGPDGVVNADFYPHLAARCPPRTPWIAYRRHEKQWEYRCGTGSIFAQSFYDVPIVEVSR